LTNTRFQIRRTSVAGRTANSTYIKSGELALNMTDQILYSMDTANNVFVIGANVISQSVATHINIGNSSVNSSINSSSFSGTSNNTAFVDGIAAANVVSNAQLQANLSNYLSKNSTDQVISGGAIITSYNLGVTNNTVNTITIDSGLCPLQYLTNNGAVTFLPPNNDGSCVVQILNGPSANAITFTGWQVNVATGVGDSYNTASGSIFNMQVLRINGNSTFMFKQIK
jgi:hypothetical protein